jgi:amidohydrolase
MKKTLIAILVIVNGLAAQESIQQDIIKIEEKLIEWRRDFHKNPELSNREYKTAKKIAKHLKEIGLKVETNIAKTGVVAILEGNQPGKVIAIRADIDGLPVTERNDLDFKSEVKTTFLNTETGVMHACGHDTHIAILMATAEVLSKHKDKIKGRIKFIFQPAEEGPPPGEEGGAKLMIKEGVSRKPKSRGYIWTTHQLTNSRRNY